MGYIKRNCDECGNEYKADERNLKRGWGLCCSKSCAAKNREKSNPTYNPETVAKNNERRKNWNIKDSNEYGDFKGRYTSEGYRIYGDTAVNESDEPVYQIS